MGVSTARIVLVTADPASVATLRRRLGRDGYAVLLAAADASVLPVLDRLRPHLIVLHAAGLDRSGLDRCRRLRRHTSAPIIVMTEQAAVGDVEAALEAGADDYVHRAMPIAELASRIKTKLRHSPPWPDAEVSSVIISGALRIDRGRHAVFVREREEPLSAKEFELLALLANHAGEAVTYEEILRVVWGETAPTGIRHRDTVTVHMRWLRRKIEDDPDAPRRLVTVRNVGYRLVEEPLPGQVGETPRSI